MIPEFADRKALFDYLRANKSLLIASKKAAMKYADVVSVPVIPSVDPDVAKAQANTALLDMAEFGIKVVINTTNIRDSHKDVHIPGLWKKTLKETKDFYLMQEHVMQFDHVISDRVKAYTQQMTWKELGQKWDGMTEALIFDAAIEKDRNAYMAEQYAKGRVKNHSVGMRYVKLELAMNSDSKYDEEERKVWDKYIDQIINRDEVEEDGYFWAVTEAKIIEGSSVIMGSNHVTPTQAIGIEPPKSLNAADQVTASEPVNWDALIQAFKSKK